MLPPEFVRRAVPSSAPPRHPQCDLAGGSRLVDGEPSRQLEPRGVLVRGSDHHVLSDARRHRVAERFDGREPIQLTEFFGKEARRAEGL